LDKVDVAIVRGAGLIVMLSACVAESGPAFAPEESTNLTVKLEVAGVVGVPESVPELLRARPAGNDEPDARLQASVPAPPADLRVAL
jgi:hypothetical protein